MEKVSAREGNGGEVYILTLLNTNEKECLVIDNVSSSDGPRVWV